MMMATQNNTSKINIEINHFNLKNITKYSVLSLFLILFLFSFYYLIPIIAIALLKD